jgi:hypothetical protein
MIMLLQGWILIPRSALFDGLMLAVIAWVMVATVHIVSPSKLARRVTYMIVAVFIVLWLTGVVRVVSGPG